MTESELREKMAEVFRQSYWFAKEHPKHKETLDISKLTFTQADQILALIKEAGYIQLADNQNLPSHLASKYIELRDEGWRKVKLEAKDEKI